MNGRRIRRNSNLIPFPFLFSEEEENTGRSFRFMFAIFSTVTEKSFSDDEVDYFSRLSCRLSCCSSSFPKTVCLSDDDEMM